MNLIGAVYAFNIEDVWPLAPKPGRTVPSTLAGLISFFYPRALLLAGIIFFILIVLAGFSFIAAAGSDDPQTKEKWKRILTYGVIGLVIIFGAFWILQIINVITAGSLGGPKTPKGIL